MDDGGGPGRDPGSGALDPPGVGGEEERKNLLRADQRASAHRAQQTHVGDVQRVDLPVRGVEARWTEGHDPDGRVHLHRDRTRDRNLPADARVRRYLPRGAAYDREELELAARSPGDHRLVRWDAGDGDVLGDARDHVRERRAAGARTGRERPVLRHRHPVLSATTRGAVAELAPKPAPDALP